MSIRLERLFYALLPDQHSIEYLAREGMTSAVLPTEDLRQVYDWAMGYYRQSRKAPTPEAMAERFGVDLFADNEVDVTTEPEESIEWVVEMLRSNYVRSQTARISKDIVQEVAAATPEDRVRVLNESASKLAALVSELTPRTQMVDLREEAIAILEDHDAAAANAGRIEGVTFGLPEIDAHYGGVQAGEVAVIAAPPKMGKSFMMTSIAYHNWRSGVPYALFTLENSVKMTKMRIACQALALDFTELMQGRLSENERNRLAEWIGDVLEPSDVPFPILQPEDRTPYGMMQQAQALGVQGVGIDQLTHVHSVSKRNQASRWEIVRDIMRGFNDMAQAGQLSVVLAHQINREGVKAARKTGRLEMDYLAEGAEVERASDMVFGLYGSEDMLLAGAIQWQALAVRRVPPQSFDLNWHPAIGGIGVRNPVDLSEYL